MTRHESLQTPRDSSPFLKSILKTDKVWDVAAKTEWADDVERRLRKITAQIDPKSIVLGYAIQRVKNCVTIYTVTRNRQAEYANGKSELSI